MLSDAGTDTHGTGSKFYGREGGGTQQHDPFAKFYMVRRRWGTDDATLKQPLSLQAIDRLLRLVAVPEGRPVRH